MYLIGNAGAQAAIRAHWFAVVSFLGQNYLPIDQLSSMRYVRHPATSSSQPRAADLYLRPGLPGMRQDQGRLLAPSEVVARPPGSPSGLQHLLRHGHRLPPNANGRNGTIAFRAEAAGQFAGLKRCRRPR